MKPKEFAQPGQRHPFPLVVVEEQRTVLMMMTVLQISVISSPTNVFMNIFALMMMDYVMILETVKMETLAPMKSVLMGFV